MPHAVNKGANPCLRLTTPGAWSLARLPDDLTRNYTAG